MGGQISLIASLVLTLLVLLPGKGWAQDSEIKTDATTGFKYKVLENQSSCAIVGYDRTLDGDIVIPSSISDNYGHYFVSQIGDGENPLFDNRPYFTGKIKFADDGFSFMPLSIMANAFSYLTCTKSIVIPTRVSYIATEAFNNCEIGTLVFENPNPSYLDRNAEGEGYCSDLLSGARISKIVIPGWTDTYHYILSNYTSNVSEASSSASTTVVESYDGFKFQPDYVNYTATVIGVADSYTSDRLAIGQEMSCSDGDYTVTAIGEEAFKGNTYTYIDIPSTVSSIGKNAFAESKGKSSGEGEVSKLEIHLNYEGDLSSYADDAFSDYKGDNLAIIVPSKNGEAYKTLYSDLVSSIYVTRSDGSLTDTSFSGKGYYTRGGISYTRQLTEAEQNGGYVTCCLPFVIYGSNAKYKNMFDAIYVIDNNLTKKADGRYYLSLTDKMSSTSTKVNANQPMLLKLKAGVSEIKFTSGSATILGDKFDEYSTDMTVKDEDGTELTDLKVQLCGSKEKKTDCTNIYSFNPDGTFGKHKYATLNPFRMYLNVTDANGSSVQSAAFYSSINPGDGTTAISGIQTGAAQKTAAIYSIDGKKVSDNGSTDSLAKGVYIQNGKKIVVK